MNRQDPLLKVQNLSVALSGGLQLLQGIDPAAYSRGKVNNSVRMEMAREPIVRRSLAAASVFTFVLVLCAKLFADAVRDAFDPYFAK